MRSSDFVPTRGSEGQPILSASADQRPGPDLRGDVEPHQSSRAVRMFLDRKVHGVKRDPEKWRQRRPIDVLRAEALIRP